MNRTSRTPSRGWRAALSTGADRIEKPIELLIRVCGWSSIILVVAIFCFVFWYAAPLLPKIDWFGQDGFFTSTNWHAKERSGATYGVLAMIVGNFAVAGLAMVIAIPLGLAAAVYISEFAGPRAKEWFKVAIEILAAIPSIVWGFIAITMIGPILIKYAGATMGTNLLNGGLVLGRMSVPPSFPSRKIPSAPFLTIIGKPLWHWGPTVGKSYIVSFSPRPAAACWPPACSVLAAPSVKPWRCCWRPEIRTKFPTP